MAAMIEWPEFFKELDELLDEIEKKEKKEQEEKAKKEKEAKEKAKVASVAIPRKGRSEEDLYKELADTFAAPILYLKTQYLKKGFSSDEAFTLALETYKIYVTFMLNAALGDK